MTTTATSTTTQKITAALVDAPNSTASDLATTTGLGRSAVTKQLTALARTGVVSRVEGAHDGGRRLPDKWSLTLADATPPANGRLRPGQLDALVLQHMQTLTEPIGPVAVARALGRSAGAVANCMARLTKAKQLRLVDDRPRRYHAR